jgi:NAD(P)-dependent dehydrogenase (short-subunit alcohol dehydrogenase family)
MRSKTSFVMITKAHAGAHDRSGEGPNCWYRQAASGGRWRLNHDDHPHHRSQQGPGLRTARRLVELGHTVLVGARNQNRGTDAAHQLGATFVNIDPTDDDSVKKATKAALTMLTIQYARALPGILINAADPGFTGADFNAHRGTQTVTEGTDAIVRLATLPPNGPTGTFQDRHGTVPW